ncbi:MULTISPECIES: NAD(P)/FAD-dependent oxidoreductase [Bacillaceae]|uniref:NAD(P)/FAD-dependent oxidoreductase n=1 Tax=Bacillaceae TaxID=186817 RepID=UPI001E46B170|nr:MULTISPECIES: NAD(P)/FAD-dependent oxidoreductase [Bacillaceae]MCE4049765.1 NAD(P)/FAD-dependent oxidoreductase [Bacillus sp. Au-Bac7]MCM3032310.1 NAD(P)/FAD-dependent oxidoreductase [Niallia sp. MER 6]
MKKTLDCAIIGGGIAGLQAAIQLGRYKHNVLVIDSEKGRSTLCRSYHNILGYPDGISGVELRQKGKQHAESLGVEFLAAAATKVEKQSDSFHIYTEAGEFEAKRLLLATGIIDNIPPFPELYPCLGISVYLCPDCDGYEVKNKKTIVIGNGKVGANMALTLTYWTQELVYINHGGEAIDEEVQKKLDEHHIPVINKQIKKVEAEGSNLKGYTLEDGEFLEGEHSFIAFGGNIVKSELARQLGVQVMDNNHITVDGRTKMTNVENVWAAGDVVAHSEQVTIAMGDGSQAAIWIHKSLLNEK